MLGKGIIGQASQVWEVRGRCDGGKLACGNPHICAWEGRPKYYHCNVFLRYLHTKSPAQILPLQCFLNYAYMQVTVKDVLFQCTVWMHVWRKSSAAWAHLFSHLKVWWRHFWVAKNIDRKCYLQIIGALQIAIPWNHPVIFAFHSHLSQLSKLPLNNHGHFCNSITFILILFTTSKSLNHFREKMCSGKIFLLSVPIWN